MKEKSILIKFISFVAFSFGFFFLLGNSSSVYAAAQFDILPEKNPIDVSEDSDVSIFLDTGGDSVTLARVVINYDPEIVQVAAAKSGDLFCTYPTNDNQFLVDNANGQITITGFCEEDPYVSGSEMGLFAKITFRGRDYGNTNIEFEYSELGAQGESTILDDKSPPQNLLESEPSSVNFVVAEETTTPNQPDDGDDEPVIPKTAIENPMLIIVPIVILVVGAGIFTAVKVSQDKVNG